jgi:hypothetical protein
MAHWEVSELRFYQFLLLLTYVLAGITFILLNFVTAPYGRHASISWGPLINARMGWMIMESVAPIACSIAFSRGEHSRDCAPLVLYSMFMIHYLHRSIIFPLRMKAGKSSRQMPVIVAALACLWNVLNGYLQGRWLSHFGTYPDRWLHETRFLAGLAIFLAGMAINISR